MKQDIKIKKTLIDDRIFKINIHNDCDSDFFFNLNKDYSNFKEVFESSIMYDLSTLFVDCEISFENDVDYLAIINYPFTENEFLESRIIYYLSETDYNKVIDLLETGFCISGSYIITNNKIYTS